MKQLVLLAAGTAMLIAAGALAQTDSAPTPTPITSSTPQPGTGLAATKKSWNVGPLAAQKDEKPSPTRTSPTGTVPRLANQSASPQ